MKRLQLSSASKIILKRIGISAAVAIGIILAEYLISNWAGHVFDDSFLLSIVNRFSPQSDENLEDDVVYFNLGYDKQLVAVTDEFGDSIGNTVITDRNVLLKLLNIAEKAHYRYLFLDIRFEEDTPTPLDSLLFAKIRSMPNVVVSTHSSLDISAHAKKELRAKMGMADYISTYFSGFTRYKYIQGDSASVALKMYRQLDGGNIRPFGPFYLSGTSLCHNLQFLTFSEADLRKTETPSFGGEYLQMNTPTEIAHLMRGKIVAVGDMVGDVHNTYIGDVPGPVLSIRAYKALHEGAQCVNLWMAMFLFAAYSACCYIILYSSTLKIPHKLSRAMQCHPLITFCIFMLGWGFVLFVLKIIVFLLFRYSIIIMIPSLVFSILSMPSEYGAFKQNL